VKASRNIDHLRNRRTTKIPKPKKILKIGVVVFVSFVVV